MNITAALRRLDELKKQDAKAKKDPDLTVLTFDHLREIILALSKPQKNYEYTDI